MKTRLTISMMAVATAFCLMANSSFAQRGFRFGGDSLTGLLRMEEVQKELKLDGDALTKVNAYVEEANSNMRDKFSELRDQGLEQSEMRTEIQKLQNEAAAKDAKELAGLLSKDQMKRLNQLLVQRMGIAAVVRDDVAKAIGLDEDKTREIKAKIEQIQKDGQEKILAAMQDQDRDGANEARTEMQKNLESAVNDMLTDEQKKAFDEFKGAAFEFPQRQGGGRGGRGRNDF